MLATILSIIISVSYLLFFDHLFIEETFFVLLILSISLWPLTFIIYSQMWIPLQKMAQNFSPGLLFLVKKDSKLQLIMEFICLIPFIAIACFMIHHPWSWAAMLIFIGLSIDLLKMMINHLQNFLDPLPLLEITLEYSKKQNVIENQNETFTIMDIFFDFSAKGIERQMPTVSINAIDSMQKFLQTYCLKKSSASKDQLEDVKYLILNFLERIEILNEKAISAKMEILTYKILNSLAKIAITSSKIDLSLPNYILHFIGKLTEYAMNFNLLNVGDKATCILLEMGKYILPQVSLTHHELIKFYFSLIRKIEEINKKIFQIDKSTNIQLLIQPFQELKLELEKSEYSEMLDQKLILSELNRAIDQFEQLDLVMKTIPPFDFEGVNKKED